MRTALIRARVCSFSLFVLLIGCTVTSPQKINEIYKDVIHQRQTDYRVRIGDTITFRLYNRDEDLAQTILVLPDGKSDVYFMHGYKYEGKTVSEIERDFRAATAREVANAEIAVHVEPVAEVIWLVGEFEQPRQLELLPHMTLQMAISSGGGTRITGDTDWALLRRPYFNPRHPDRFRIDLNDESEEIFLLPGDQIVLGRTFLASVVAYLREYVWNLVGGGTARRAVTGGI